MPKPVDSKYRDMIVQNLSASMLVEAGAGSGKTTSLISRMLALIGSGKSTTGRMAAVTFTRKAASELKNKFQLSLEKAFKEEKDGKKRERYQTALLNFEMLFAGTIHSFCAGLLRERPIEARLDPAFQELEEEENALLRDRCWEEYLEGLHVQKTAIMKEIADLGIAPAGLEATYRNLALYPEVEVVRKKQEKPDFGSERTLFEDYLKRVEECMPATVPEKGWDSLQSALRRIRLRMRYLDIENDTDFIKVLSLLDKSIKVTQYKWPTKDIGKAEQAAFEQFRENVVSPCLDRWRQYCHFFIMELIIPAVEHFREERQKHSLMNYQDLLSMTASLLRENREVRGYFQERFTYLLVDEFQDTDPIQAEVILYLTAEDLTASSWQNVKVKPGSLFIVGDPKQSIYRFRRADIDTYNEVKRIVTKSGGEVIPLSVNFRSFPSLCEWVNPIFELKFPERATSVQPAFERMNAHKTNKGGGVMCINIPKVRGNKAEAIAAQDAERIAAFIDGSLREGFVLGSDKKDVFPYNPGDFMILLRYRKHLSIYARALEGLGIPYQITGGGAFNDSEELRQLLNLLQAISAPEDQVALISALRGMYYGASDDLLFCFKNAGGLFSFLSSQERCRHREAKAAMEEIFSSMRQMHRWTRTLPPAGALSRILDHMGVVPLAMTGEIPDTRAGNIMKTLEIGFREASRGVTSFPEMVERLMEYFNDIEVEEMSISPGKEDAVRIMNLHKAKGLEAKIVFLADPVKDASHDPEFHIRRTGEKAIGYFTASQKESEYRSSTVGIPPDWNEYVAVESKYRAAEEMRLLYVAVTRAKEFLVVSRYPDKPHTGAWKDLSPFLSEASELPFVSWQPRVKKEKMISTKAFETGRADRTELLRNGKEPSYAVEAVTKVVETQAEAVPFAGDRGMSWGRIVHRMLEAAAKDKTLDLELMAENLLKAEDRLIAEKDPLVGTVKSVMNSDLWQRMKKAEKTLIEVPFSLRDDGKEVPTIVSGVIDIIFKEPDGWVIADYKTDKVEKNLDKLIAYYKPQLEMYREFWNKISGERVKEAGLYFTDSEKWEQV